MDIVLNGDAFRVPEGATLKAVVELVGLDPGRVAIELDGTIIRRSEWNTTLVKSGSRVELVQFVGGGR